MKEDKYWTDESGVFLGVCIHSSVFMVGYYDTKIRTIGEIQNY